MRKNLLKSMLVAMMATVGMTAWADDEFNIATASCDFEGEDVMLTASGRGTFTKAAEEGNAENNVGKFATSGNAGNVAPGGVARYDFSSLAGTASKVEVSFDFFVNTMNGQLGVTLGDASVRTDAIFTNKGAWGYSNKGAIFALVTQRGKLNGSSNENYVSVNGVNFGSTTELQADALTGKWITIRAIIDVTGKKVSYTITNRGEEEAIVEVVDADFFSASDANKCTQIDIQSGVNSTTAFIDNIDIKAYVPANQKTATYTIRYMYGETELKEARTVGETVVGTAAIILDSDKDPIWNEDKTTKYLYESDDAEGKTVAEDGSTVITINFREAETWSYTLNATYNGAIIEPLATGSVIEGESQGITLRGYYNVDGTLVAWKSADGKNYSYTMKPTQNDYKASADYTAAPSFTDVVFFKEAEEIEGLEPATSLYLPERFSNGQGAYAKDEAKAITTLNAGKYKITAQAMGTQSACKFTLRAGSVPVWTTTTGSSSFYINNPGGGVAGSVFEIAEDGTVISLDAAGGNGSSSKVMNLIDYIIIQQVNEVGEGETVIDVAAEEAKYAAILEAVANLKAEIAAAEAIETEGKQDVDPFLDAIATAKTFLTSEDVEAINQAIADLKAAVEAFNAANAVSENDLNVTWETANYEIEGTSTKGRENIDGKVINLDNNVTLTAASGTADTENYPGIVRANPHVGRLFNGNTLTIKGNKLHKIVITADKNLSALSADGSTINEELNQIIWEGELNEVVFTCTVESGNWDFTKVYVVYEDPEAVGIDEVKSEKAAQQGIFNLQGQRVEKAGKGLYIVGGKKVIF